MRLFEILSDNHLNILYHVSRKSNRAGILQHGLIPQNKEFANISRKPGIYAIQTIEQAKDWAFWFMFEIHEAVDIWKIIVPKNVDIIRDPSDDMQEIYDSCIIYQNIPATSLTLVGTQPVRKHSKYAPPSSTKVNDELK